MIDIETALNEGKAIAAQLLSTSPLYFRDMTPSDIPESTAGVYAIFECNTEEVLYVGRTKDLRRRLYYNHLQGPKTNARLKKYLNMTLLVRYDEENPHRCYLLITPRLLFVRFIYNLPEIIMLLIFYIIVVFYLYTQIKK